MQYLFILLLLFSFPAYAGETFDAVTKGKHCHDNVRQSVMCNYHVGESLSISITDVGHPTAAIMFTHSDFNDDYVQDTDIVDGTFLSTIEERRSTAIFNRASPTFATATELTAGS